MKGTFWDDLTPDNQPKLPKPGWQPPAPPSIQLIQQTPLEMPPGFAGDIARYFCGSVAQSVPEAGIAGALGMLAGINGGAYTVSSPGTGMNLFVLALALSGLGKEAAHRLHHLMHVACNVVDTRLARARDFVVASKPVSEAALSRALAQNKCHVSVQGEFCRTLREMSEAKTSSPLYGLMTLMTALFEKSGPQAMVGGREYSDPAKNVKPIVGAAYSVLGEGTPGTFYDSLTESMMEDGFLSRWTVLDSPQVEVPERNLNPQTEPPEEMIAVMRWMLTTAAAQIDHPVHVPADEAATARLEAFREHCVSHLNRAKREERRRALWTRAYMKSYRVSGNLAVADYWKERYLEHKGLMVCRPLAVHDEHAAWAIALELRNIAALTARIEGGDTGSTDDSRQLKAFHYTQLHLSSASP